MPTPPWIYFPFRVIQIVKMVKIKTLYKLLTELHTSLGISYNISSQIFTFELVYHTGL